MTARAKLGRPRKHRPSLGSTDERKVCNDCGESKRLTDYYKRAAAPDGLQSVCSECLSSRAKHYRENGRNGISNSIIVHVLKSNYLSDEELALNNHRAYASREEKRCPKCGCRMRYRSVLRTCESCHALMKGEE